MSEQDPERIDARLRFSPFWAALKAGDERAQSIALDRVMPAMLLAVQRRFGSSRSVDPTDAVMSACRTILRRKHHFTKRRGDQVEVVEPRDWGDLIGLCVMFACNKARTKLKKQTERPFSECEGPEDEQSLAVDVSDAGGESVVDEVLRHEIDATVERVHDSLEPMERIVLRGRLDDLTASEIATQVERELQIYRTGDAIYKCWQRKIVPRLQSALSDYSDER